MCGCHVIALAAYAGAGGCLTFPWVAPHVHVNSSLNGVIVDPFARADDVSTWLNPNDPVPPTASEEADRIAFTTVKKERVDALMSTLRAPEREDYFASITDDTERGFELVIEATTYPTRFSIENAGALLYDDHGEQKFERTPRMSLPFLADDYDGIGFADDLGYR